jgi:hypothetical protein
MQFEQGDFRIIIFAMIDDDCSAAAKPSTCRHLAVLRSRPPASSSPQSRQVSCHRAVGSAPIFRKTLFNRTPEIKGADASDEISLFGVGARTV